VDISAAIIGGLFGVERKLQFPVFLAEIEGIDYQQYYLDPLGTMATHKRTSSKGLYTSSEDADVDPFTPLGYLILQFENTTERPSSSLADVKNALQRTIDGQKDGSWVVWELLPSDTIELVQQTIDSFDALVEDALEKGLLIEIQPELTNIEAASE
jgi:hypothetical protein